MSSLRRTAVPRGPRLARYGGRGPRRPDQALRRLPRLRPETLDAYARRAVVNASISHARKRTETPTELPPERPTSQAEDVSLPLIAAIGLLPPVQRAVVAFRFLETYPSPRSQAAQRVREHRQDPHHPRTRHPPGAPPRARHPDRGTAIPPKTCRRFSVESSRPLSHPFTRPHRPAPGRPTASRRPPVGRRSRGRGAGCRRRADDCRGVRRRRRWRLEVATDRRDEPVTISLPTVDFGARSSRPGGRGGGPRRQQLRRPRTGGATQLSTIWPHGYTASVAADDF